MSDYNVVSGSNQIPFQNKANTKLVFKRFIDLEPMTINIEMYGLPDGSHIEIWERDKNNYEERIFVQEISHNNNSFEIIRLFEEYLNKYIPILIEDSTTYFFRYEPSPDILSWNFLNCTANGGDYRIEQFITQEADGSILLPDLGYLFEYYVETRKNLDLIFEFEYESEDGVVTGPTTPTVPTP